MYGDPSLEGEPQYVPLPPPEHTYPYGNGPSMPTRRNESWAGWLSALVATFALATALLPWATIYSRADSGFGPVTDVEVVHGYDGVLGPPTLIFYSLCIVLGVVIGLRQGITTAAISSLLISVVMLVFLLMKSVAIRLSAALEFGDVVTEPGFWVALVATCGLLALSLVALARRTVVR